ncbi:hypothetical protein DPMN_165734 [Dreissena polymorpha]|uniref:Uncharacterized protein n=1 Tax=Dreissena polymorpha TaxID=45954 RepID=A0A9D4IX98_DREPO|nr:hypothetical protein DPMN_165734 [Dreissena polymorpha]
MTCYQGSQRPATRQQKLSFSQSSRLSSPPLPPGRDPAPRINENQRQATPEVNEYNSNAEILSYLREMKLEVRTDLANLNLKLGDMSQSINNLQKENEMLRNENKHLWGEISSLKTKVDSLEGHSKRNNLKFHGIEGAWMNLGILRNRKLRKI